MRALKGKSKFAFIVIVAIASLVFTIFPSLKNYVLGDDVKAKSSEESPSSILKRGAEMSVYVIGISDGDTFHALTQDKNRLKCRIYGIDAPELKQPFGKKSKDALARHIFNKDIKIKIQSTDRYKRQVVSVYYEGNDIGLQMIKDGMAWHYDSYYKSDDYAVSQLGAKTRKIGLWTDKNPIAPWQWRKEQKKGSV